MSYSPTLGRWMETDPAGYVDGMNPYEFVGGNPVNRVDPLGLWYTQDEHRQFQNLINKVKKLVDSKDISRCGAFAFLMGALWDMQGQLRSDPGQYLGNAVNYFTDQGFIKKALPDLVKRLPKREWTNDWLSPSWISSHGPTGKNEGFIQVDGDNGGRQDHFLINAYLQNTFPALFRLAIPWLGIDNDAASDVIANRLGRNFESFVSNPLNELERAFQTPHAGPRGLSGRQIENWISSNLCDESQCDVKHKGPISDEMRKNLLQGT